MKSGELYRVAPVSYYPPFALRDAVGDGRDKIRSDYT